MLTKLYHVFCLGDCEVNSMNNLCIVLLMYSFVCNKRGLGITAGLETILKIDIRGSRVSHNS